MTWAAVSWAYKDVITSAKLAQMNENLRVHDHITTDQGARLGLLGWAEVTAVAIGASAAEAVIATANVTIPSLPTGRRVIVVAQFIVRGGGAGVPWSTALKVTNTAGAIIGTPFRIPSVTTANDFQGFHIGSETPAAGARTYVATISNSTATAGTVDFCAVGAFVL